MLVFCWLCIMPAQAYIGLKKIAEPKEGEVGASSWAGWHLYAHGMQALVAQCMQCFVLTTNTAQ